MIDRIRGEIQQRIGDLKPLVDEHDRLVEAEAALHALVPKKAPSESAEVEAKRSKDKVPSGQYNHKRRRYIEPTGALTVLNEPEYSCWTFKRKGDENYRLVADRVSKDTAERWLAGENFMS